MKLYQFIFSSLSLITAFTLQANDSVAVLSGGNLELKNNKDISMKSEKLYISEDKVTVDYEFKNNSTKAITTIISFPLMRLEAEQPYNIDASKFEKNEDALDFKLKINGKDYPYKVHAKKVAFDNETPIDVTYHLDVQYYWEYTFAPNSITQVSHSYKPVLGTGGSQQIEEEDKKTYCVDSAFLKGFESLKQRILKKIREENPKMSKSEEITSLLNQKLHFNSYRRFSYIVKTAKNWAGPIGNFQLSIEKKQPSTLLSTCWNGLKKTKATLFEFSKDNFVPEQDLEILFMNEK